MGDTGLEPFYINTFINNSLSKFPDIGATKSATISKDIKLIINLLSQFPCDIRLETISLLCDLYDFNKGGSLCQK